jgi:hypothetical protein
MALYLVIFFAVGFVLDALTGTVALFRLNPAAFGSDAAHRAELHRALHGPALLTLVGAVALHLLVFGALGQRAGYRGARILQLLIPGWNYVVMRRILWCWTDITALGREAIAAGEAGPTRRFTREQFATKSSATSELPRGYVVPQYGAPADEGPVYRLPAGYVPIDVTPAGGTMDITPGRPDGLRLRRFR